tara:strand:+ start:277 stop:873 length:597 start_codon:yes stop_codon:yes gene_type:complete
MPTLSLGGKVIATQTGSAEPQIADAVTFPGKSGAILQTKTYIDPTAWTQVLDTDFETLVNGSGVKFAVSITPTLTGSKHIVTVTFGAFYAHASQNFGLGVRLCRNGTPIRLSTATDSTPLTTFSSSSSFESYMPALTAVVLDETLNTKDVPVEYTLQMQRHAISSYTMAINKTGNTRTDNAAYGQRTSSQIMAQEVVV